MKEEDAKDMYVMMEISYIKEMGRNIEEDNSDLFPYDWYKTTNYILKSEILLEAIKTNTSITNTKKYQLLLEGVRK